MLVQYNDVLNDKILLLKQLLKTYPTINLIIYFSGSVRCRLIVSVYIYCDCRDTVFQIELEECNIPINIGGLLDVWLAAQAFSQVVRVSASYE